LYNLAVHRQIDQCRVCGNSHLEPLLDLGHQALTGVFPKRRDDQVEVGPLRLVKCHGSNACGLVQLEHSYAVELMYGDNYGYRSGLNQSMARHLQGKIARILSMFGVPLGSVVLDIGSNDGTSLAAYPADRFDRIGIDPTASKFRAYYQPGIHVLCDLFTEDNFRAAFGDRQAQVVTSFAMFYDLEDPLAFMRDVRCVLADDGVWAFEQSYLPFMLERNAYDTICHEHLEYYSLTLIDWMTRRAGFKIVDVEFNDVNGGSFSVVVAKTTSKLPEFAKLSELLARERALGVDGLEIYASFASRVVASRDQLRAFVADAKATGKVVAAVGASTKGNVVLQYCGFEPSDVLAIGEVNEDKFGAFTPGTLIPIVPEGELIAKAPDYLIVLPWHFRDTFMRKRETLPTNTRLVFPLPTLEVV
jgi:NDP-4-keto-2,6-dideoxyhexose 3-C-methyltransferase